MDFLWERHGRTEVAGNRIVHALEPRRFDQSRIEWQVIGDAECRAVLEAFHQQPQAVQRAQAVRSHHPVQAAGARPIKTACKKGQGGLAVVNALEQIEKRGAFVVERVVCLLYTSDAADERSSGDLGGRRILKKQERE